LLSLNDEILHLAGGRRSAQTLRLGIPGDFAGAKIPGTLSKLRSRWPDVRFKVRHGVFEDMLAEMRQGELDLVVGVAVVPPAFEARYMWTEDTVWIRGKETRLEPGAPVPLAAYGERCPYYRTAVSALYNAGRKCDLVFNAASTLSLAAAVRAGLGVMAHTRSRMVFDDLTVWEDGPLPKLAKVYGGIYLRDGGNREELEELADAVVEVLRPKEAPTRKPIESVPRVLVEAGDEI
jgi:DNA-binding transcriptional LysR family regulator